MRYLHTMVRVKNIEESKKFYCDLLGLREIRRKDYPEGKVLDNPKSHFWMEDKRYEPFLNEWIKRPEYRKRILKGN